MARSWYTTYGLANPQLWSGSVTAPLPRAVVEDTQMTMPLQFSFNLIAIQATLVEQSNDVLAIASRRNQLFMQRSLVRDRRALPRLANNNKNSNRQSDMMTRTPSHNRALQRMQRVDFRNSPMVSYPLRAYAVFTPQHLLSLLLTGTLA